MRDHIARLESEARILEPDGDARDQLNTQILGHAERFLSRMPDGKGYEQEDTSERINTLPFTESGYAPEVLLETLDIAVDRPGINPASGGHIGYIPGGGVYPSALADYLAAVTNRYAGIYFANPGAVRMENMLLRWMAEMIGYPDTAQGNLTSGGSIANLIAITTARDALGIKSAQIPTSVIYLSAHTHHSVQKAVRIAGMQECVLRHIPLDKEYRMHADALQDQVKSDMADGLRPAIVIASLGSTDTGAIDPIHEIADIASTSNIWLHIDAAYGGFFHLVPRLQQHFVGVEKSDSYVLDPHKGMFLPYGTGAVLIRDGSQLFASHKYSANYMQDAQNQNTFSPADLSPELTKHFRGLRMWLPMQLFGLSPFRAALEEKWMLAQYFFERIRAAGFETGPPPQLSVVTYRYTDCADPNAFNAELIKAIHRDGRIFITSTMLDGVFWLRLAVLSFRTHLSHIDLLLEMLTSEKDSLLKGT